MSGHNCFRLPGWYPTGTPEPECVIAHDSILPVINFYHSRLLSAGLNIRKCKVCGKYFLAESLKYELCSEKCRKEQGKIKKREFDRTAPLGSLLMNFHQDTDRAWNEFGFMPFWNALHSNRWKQPELEKIGFDFILIQRT